MLQLACTMSCGQGLLIWTVRYRSGLELRSSVKLSSMDNARIPAGFLWASPSPQPKRRRHRFSHFCTDDRRVSLGAYTLEWATPSPSKLPLQMGDLDPI